MINFSILLFEDHPIYRDALTEKLNLDFEWAGVPVIPVDNKNDAISIIENSNKKWVVLLDLGQPDLKPEELICIFKNHERVEYLIILSGQDENEWKIKSKELGADLFISKNNTSFFIYQAICSQMNIKQPVSNSDLRINLTPRYMQVLKYIALGDSNKVIADKLFINENTTKLHINAIFKRLNVSNRTQAVHKAKMLRLID